MFGSQDQISGWKSFMNGEMSHMRQSCCLDKVPAVRAGAQHKMSAKQPARARENIQNFLLLRVHETRNCRVAVKKQRQFWKMRSIRSQFWLPKKCHVLRDTLREALLPLLLSVTYYVTVCA